MTLGHWRCEALKPIEREEREREREGYRSRNIAAMVSERVRDVWGQNLHQELGFISELCKTSCNFVFLDAEFPGFLHSPPRGSSEEEIYSAVKYNVDRMKLIQLGITLTNEESYASWQFNMKDFDPRVDACSEASIEFLKKSGIDFDKNLRDGVSADVLSKELAEKLLRGGEGGLKWITFHGVYDLAYLIKIVYDQMPLPDTLAGFLRLVRKLFGTRVYDLKYMAKEYDASLSEVGLVRLSRVLEIEWTGSSHQAGHDSLLTAMAFWKMKGELSDFDEGKHAGILYGFEEHGKKELENIAMPFINPVALASFALSRQSCAPLAFHPVPRPYAYRDVFPPRYGPVPGPPYAYRGGFPAGYRPIPRPYGYWPAPPPQPSPFLSV